MAEQWWQRWQRSRLRPDPAAGANPGDRLVWLRRWGLQILVGGAVFGLGGALAFADYGGWSHAPIVPPWLNLARETGVTPTDLTPADLGGPTGRSGSIDPGRSADQASGSPGSTVPGASSDQDRQTADRPSGTVSAHSARFWQRNFLVKAAAVVLPSLVQVGDRSTDGDRAGAGFVWDDRGRIVTSAQLVEGRATVWVTLPDGRRMEAAVLGTDPMSQVAVLDLPVADLPALAQGDALAARSGDWSLAAGHPAGLDRSLAVGTLADLPQVGWFIRSIASVNRHLHTDAALSAGFIGGPLADEHGRALGLLVRLTPPDQGLKAWLAPRSPARPAIAAVPIDRVRQAAKQLIAQGRVEHPYLGLVGVALSPATRDRLNRPQPSLFSPPIVTPGPATHGDSGKIPEAKSSLPPSAKSSPKPSTKSGLESPAQASLPVRFAVDRGVAILWVEPGSPAALAGLAAGDVIVESRVQEPPARLNHLEPKPTARPAPDLPTPGPSRSTQTQPPSQPTTKTTPEIKVRPRPRSITEPGQIQVALDEASIGQTLYLTIWRGKKRLVVPVVLTNL